MQYTERYDNRVLIMSNPNRKHIQILCKVHALCVLDLSKGYTKLNQSPWDLRDQTKRHVTEQSCIEYYNSFKFPLPNF
jgi:hypothetical protein